MAIEYRIDDAENFVRNVGETPEMFEKLLRRVAENAIVRTVAGMPVERVIRTQTDAALGDFTLAVKRRLSAELARLETGVKVLNVEAKTVEPGRVRDSFLAVTNAKSAVPALLAKYLASAASSSAVGALWYSTAILRAACQAFKSSPCFGKSKSG